MNASTTRFFLVALMTASSGCLTSPLLNHAQAKNRNLEQSLEIRTPDSLPNSEPQLADCTLAFPKQNLCASLTWEKMPTDDETGTFTLRFWDPSVGTVNGPYVSPAQSVSAMLWMPSMGHGSSPIHVSPELDASGAAIPGIFNATGAYFSMPGHWQMRVQLKQDRQVVEEAKLDLNV